MTNVEQQPIGNNEPEANEPSYQELYQKLLEQNQENPGSVDPHYLYVMQGLAEPEEPDEDLTYLKLMKELIESGVKFSKVDRGYNPTDHNLI